VERVLIGEASEVLIGHGVLEEADLLPAREGRRRAAVLTQPGAASYGRRAARRLRREGLDAQVRVLPDREEAKTWQVAADVYDWLAELGMTRDDTVVGVGGGAVTDLAGFVAATYMRGIEAVHVPTTLLGAVDAAIGGKTGLNLRGKNLVGAFWQPSRVLIDLSLLADLPTELRREGLAEALKAGLVGDPELVEIFRAEGEAAPLEDVVVRAVRVKARVVGEDFREEGRRAVLNYGHTIGHALEIAGQLSHGEAVAVGMVAAGAASEQQVGFQEAAIQEALIAELGLPTRVQILDPTAVRGLLGLDKKRTENGLRMVLLRAVGDPVVEPVGAATVDAALEAVRA
jgi:3-dehydroquinate synthase